MEYTVQSIMKRRKILRNFSIVFLSVVVSLTFFSKTIDTFLLPKVSVCSAKSGAMTDALEFDGEVAADDIEKVYSGGDWKILEVLVKPGSEAEKGSKLARVDTADMLIKLAKKELDVLACENDLEKYKTTYDDINLLSYERDMERSLKEIRKCESELEMVREMYVAGAEALTAVTSLEDKLENLEVQYDIALETFNGKKKEKASKAAEYKRTLEEKTMELNIKKNELEEIRESMPSIDGYLESSVQGRVKTVTIQSGSNTVKGQELFEVIKKGTNLSVKWTADPLKSDTVKEGDEITLVYERGDKSAVIYSKIFTKTYLQKEKKYEFVSRLDVDKVKLGQGEDEKEVLLQEGDVLTVQMTKRSSEYELIIPSSCIKEEMNMNVVHVIREREGALGDELFVESVNVKVLKSNGNDYAVEGFLKKDDRVVIYSTKPLSGGVRVKLK